MRDRGGELVNIPNVLTILRFVIIPIFGYYLYNKLYYVSAVLFLLAGVTDVLDGYIARKYNLVTSWGKLADPLADKLMQVTALALLSIQRKIPPIVLAIIIIKELLMGLGGLIIYKYKGLVVQANWYGKMATVVFYIAILMIIAFDLQKSYNNIAIGIAVISALFALFMYSQAFIKMKNA